MNMKSLLEKMMKFAGEPEQKSGDQVRGTEKAKKSKDHPFKGRLVGDSVEPQSNMLEELDKETKDKSIEWSLAEAWEEFKEAAFKDTESKRPTRAGSRPGREYTSDAKPSKRYKKVDEATQEETWQGWKIRYETTPQIKGQPLRWMVWHTKRGTESAHEGQANTPQEAVEAAKAWIQSGGNAKEITTSTVTIDFNVKFATDIVNGNDFYAKIVQGPTLVISSDAKPGFKRSHIRTQKNRATESTTMLPMISLSNSEATSAGLKAHGRYILGDTQQNPDGTLSFPLIYQSTVQAKGDMMRLGKPGLTVAMNREVSGLEEEQCIDKDKITKFHKKLDTLVHSTFGQRPEEMKEDATELNVGDDVVITGPVEHQGETGVIDSFGQDKRFVVVNLYNHGKKSFHSSDVSYNDYADSDAEEAEMYDRDPDFRKWADTQVDEGWESGPDEPRERERDPDWEYDQRRQEKLDIEAEKEQAKRPQEKVYTLVGRGPNYEPNYKFPGEYASQEDAIAARAKLMADPNTPNPRDIGISSHIRYLDESRETPLLDKEDYAAKKKALQDIQMDPSTAKDPELSAEVIRRLAGLEQQRSDLGMDESRAHKILARKLADIERSKNPPVALDDAGRAEQAKADYREYVAKMKKKDPNFRPMFKIDEYGADAVPSATSTSAADKVKAKNVAQASQALKAATGSTAPAQNIVKAIDAASQGKSVGQQDMKAIEPLMKDIATVATEPKLAGQFRSLMQQVDREQKLQGK